MKAAYTYQPEDLFIQFLGLLVWALMLGDWGDFSRMRVVALISLAGLTLLIKRIGLTRDDIQLYAMFIISDMGILLSAVRYQDMHLLSYHLGLIICVFPFVQLLIVRYKLSWGTLVAAAICTLPALFPQYLAGGGNVATDIVSTLNTRARFAGLSGDPNYTALALTVPMVGALFLARYRTARIKRYWVLLYIVLLGACLMTGSRAGIGAAVLISLLPFLGDSQSFSGKRLLLAACLIVVVGSVVRFGLYDYLFYFQQRTGGSASTYFADHRYEVWYQALLITIESSPINRFDQTALIWQYGQVVHNFLLDIGLTFGSYTMAVHLFVLIVGGVSVLRRLRALKKVGTAFYDNVYAFIAVLSIAFLLVAGTLPVGTDSKYWFLYSVIFAAGFSRRIAKRAATSAVSVGLSERF